MLRSLFHKFSVVYDYNTFLSVIVFEDQGGG